MKLARCGPPAPVRSTTPTSHQALFAIRIPFSGAGSPCASIMQNLSDKIVSSRDVFKENLCVLVSFSQLHRRGTFSSHYIVNIIFALRSPTQNARRSTLTHIKLNSLQNYPQCPDFRSTYSVFRAVIFLE